MGSTAIQAGQTPTKAGRLIAELYREGPRVLRQAADERMAWALLEGAFEQSPLGIVLLDPDGRLRRVNAAFTRLVGRSQGRLIGSDPMVWTDLAHPDDLEPERRQIKRCEAGQSDGYTMVRRYSRGDHQPLEWRWTYVTAWALRDPGTGDIVQYVKQVADLAEPIIVVDLDDIADRRAHGDVEAGIYASAG